MIGGRLSRRPALAGSDVDVSLVSIPTEARACDLRGGCNVHDVNAEVSCKLDALLFCLEELLGQSEVPQCMKGRHPILNKKHCCVEIKMLALQHG